MYELQYRRRVEFADTDMAGVVHFARFFVFMESAEHQLLLSLGVPPGAFQDAAGRSFAWPRATATCDYLAPARFGDELDIGVTVERLGTRSLTYGFDIRRGDLPIARGRVTAVCCAQGDDGRFHPVPLPETLVSRLQGEDG